MTTIFYAPPDAFSDGRVRLPKDEARHAVKVLRASPGDKMVVVDGEGGWHHVVLEHVDRRTAEGRVVETRREVGEPAFGLTVGLALLKQRSRFETLLEKAVELGVTRIVPLVTRHAERDVLKASRSEAILIAALKQCGRSRCPQLDEPTELADALALEADLRFMAHEAAAPEQHLTRLLQEAAAPSAHVAVLVGPEGGFAPEEVEAAEAAGWQVASLGPRRLRAETAALAAVTHIALTLDALSA